MVEGKFLNPVKGAKFWHTKSDLLDAHLVKHVVMGCVLMKGVSDDNKLPPRCNVKKATEMGAQKIQFTDHDRMMDEIFRREKLENPDHKQIEDEAGKRMVQRLLKETGKEQNRWRRIDCLQIRRINQSIAIANPMEEGFFL